MANKPLSFFDFVILVISLVIGMGIFSTPTRVAASAGSELMFFAVWIIGGIMAICGGLVYGQLGKAFPDTGAYYKIFAQAYHPAIGFGVNILLFICNATSLAIVALIGAEYTAHLFGITHPSNTFGIVFGFVCISLFVLVNMRGMYSSSKVLNILLILKIALMLVLLATLLKPHSLLAPDAIIASSLSSNKSSLGKMFLISLIPVCFTYGGYQQTLNFGSEYANKNYFNRGIILGIAIVILFYIGLNIAYCKAYTFAGLSQAQAIGAGLFSIWFGNAGSKVFDVLVLFSVLAYTNVLLMSNPRAMYAMALDGLLPKALLYKHQSSQALVVGLICFYILSSIVLFIGKNIDAIMGFTIFLDSIGMIASVGSLFFILKKSNQLPFYTKVLAAIFIIFYLLVLTGVVLKDASAAALGAGLLIAFIAVGYWRSKRL
jgi:basic amino acid/polyamine antiporter, APA family